MSGPGGPSRAALHSTLVGVATGTPDGGVAVVRLSGPDAFAVARRLAGSLPEARRLGQRRLRLGLGAPQAGADPSPADRAVTEAEPGERALVVCMPGPESFTGEDVVELHVHAGERNVGAVVSAALRAGAVSAGPGDFSRRAFDHGRLTLDQAEGLAAIIGAGTEAALAQARRLAAGQVGAAVEALRERIVELHVEVEANLDFPEDVEAGDVVRWRSTLVELEQALAGWLGRFEAGRRARSRPRVVIAGPVNAGKSSLFNALLGRDRALVSAQPGTTRDYVEAALELGAYGITLVDTAGQRGGADSVEEAGIAWAREQVAGADVVLWVEAADEPPIGASLVAAEATSIAVESKRDLGCARPDWIGVSVREAAGLVDVRERLLEWFRAGVEAPWIGLERHRARAAEARGALGEAMQLLREGGGLELVAFALGVAGGRLGEITGRSAVGPVGDDVLDAIFSRFCIGK